MEMGTGIGTCSRGGGWQRVTESGRGKVEVESR